MAKLADLPTELVFMIVDSLYRPGDLQHAESTPHRNEAFHNIRKLNKLFRDVTRDIFFRGELKWTERGSAIMDRRILIDERFGVQLDRFRRDLQTAMERDEHRVQQQVNAHPLLWISKTQSLFYWYKREIAHLWRGNLTSIQFLKPDIDLYKEINPPGIPLQARLQPISTDLSKSRLKPQVGIHTDNKDNNQRSSQGNENHAPEHIPDIPPRIKPLNKAVASFKSKASQKWGKLQRSKLGRSLTSHRD